MGKVIQELWILTESGIVLYSRVYDKEINDQLFGGFISALNMFVESFKEGALSSLVLQNTRFTFIKREKLIFITNTPKNVKEKKIRQALEAISDRFLQEYGGILENWDSDISYFTNFESEIQDTLEDPVKEFWQDFWIGKIKVR